MADTDFQLVLCFCRRRTFIAGDVMKLRASLRLEGFPVQVGVLTSRPIQVSRFMLLSMCSHKHLPGGPLFGQVAQEVLFLVEELVNGTSLQALTSTLLQTAAWYVRPCGEQLGEGVGSRQSNL